MAGMANRKFMTPKPKEALRAEIVEKLDSSKIEEL
jgi:hypothetical protein